MLIVSVCKSSAKRELVFFLHSHVPFIRLFRLFSPGSVTETSGLLGLSESQNHPPSV